MSMIWFRYHADVLNNKRVQKLPAELFRLWVNCQCILVQEDVGASGKMPPIEDCAYSLRMSVEETVRNFDLLVSAGMLKRQNVTNSETKCNKNETKSETKSTVSQRGNGTLFTEEKFEYFVKGWSKKQYKSDVSTERVKRFRKRSKTVTGNGPDQIRSDSDSEQIRGGNDLSNEIDKKKKKPSGKWNVEIFLKDPDRREAKRAAPDWSQDVLILKFNEFIVHKAKEYPRNPSRAYVAWVKTFTANNEP